MIEKVILERLRGYTEAFYHKDFDKLVNYLHQDEIKSFRENLEWVAKAMEPFGETEGLMSLFQGISAEELTLLSDKEFVAMFFGNTIQKFEHKEIMKMVDSIRIDEIDHAEYIATVAYSFDNIFEESSFRMGSELSLIKSQGIWYVLFRPGMEEAFSRYKFEIENFRVAKQKDNSDFADTKDEDIETFGLYGFRTYGEDIIIYPRFKAVDGFSEGLAAVKAFNKWGYINKKGDFVIKPSFLDAASFSEGLAKVGQLTSNLDRVYGFINKKGKLIIDYKYQDAGSFSEGLAAVQLNGLWGYINRKAEVVINFIYQDVAPFEGGEARVEHAGDFFVIDYNGVVLRDIDDEMIFGHDDDDDDDDDDFFGEDDSYEDYF